MILYIILSLLSTAVFGTQIESTEDGKTFFLQHNEENPLENGGNYEGDMVLTEDQLRSIQGLSEKNGISEEFYRWPNRVIPYELTRTFTRYEKGIILQAMKQITSRTCLSFKRRSTEMDFISIQRGNGCSSNVGRIRGRQFVTLGSGCLIGRPVIHELLHVIGFFHMQSSTDRDKYVNINWNNIQPGRENNFQIASTSNKYRTVYDIKSIMHYTSFAFSRNNRPTITAKDGTIIRQSSEMSALDIRRINNMYKC